MAAAAAKVVETARQIPLTPKLRNGIGAFILQLQELKINFCGHGGSSRYAREYIQKELVEFARENPSVAVVVQEFRGRHPCLKAQYLNGNSRAIGIKNLVQKDIHKYVMYLRGCSGAKIKRLNKPVLKSRDQPMNLWSVFQSTKPMQKRPTASSKLY